MDFTIITPTYDCESTIEENLRSVFAQKFVTFEHIIQDGGSSDRTVEYCKRYGANVVVERDEGIYDAMNKAVQRSNGRYLVFLNGDDYLLKDDVLYNAMKELDKFAGPVFGYATTSYVSQSGEYIGKSKIEYFNRNQINWKFYQIPHLGMIIDRSILHKYPYSIKYKTSSDYRLLVQCMLDQEVAFCRINCDFAAFRDGGKSTSTFVVHHCKIQ